jgi:molecular chaperone HtpG
MGQEMPESKPVLEINPNHEIVQSLNSCSDDTMIEDISWLLLDQAKVAEGMELKDPIAFAQRLNRIMAKSF